MGRHRGFTPEDYQRLASAGMTMAEAARFLDVKMQTVWVMAKRYEIAFAAGKKGRKARAELVQAEV